MFDKDQLNQMRKDNLTWPLSLKPWPKEDWPLSIRTSARMGDELISVWRSRTFLVQLFYQEGKYPRLSVQRTEWDHKTKRFKDGISWDELQRIKAECGYADFCALEVYPPDNLLVNVANIRHLFLLPKGTYPKFTWTENLLS